MVLLISMPEQVVPGQVVEFRLTVDDAVRTRSAVPTVLTSVDGMATVRVNDVKACRAEIRDGRGSCSAAIKDSGRLVVTATLDGTEDGTPVAAAAAVKVPSASLAIGRAIGHFRQCRLVIRVRGTSTFPGRPLTLEIQHSHRAWEFLGVTTVRSNASWTHVVRSRPADCSGVGPVKVRARVDQVTTAPVRIRLTSHRADAIAARLRDLLWR